MAEKILLVDDEQALLETLGYNLRREGFEVLTAADGERAVAVAREQRPDLIVLDVMLPRLSGLDVCRAVRRESNVPILMLSARDEEIDKVVGLEIGADDYMTKPFALRELLARLRAMLRRAQMAAPAAEPGNSESVLRNDEIEVNLREHRVVVRGEEVELKPKEFDLLAHLMRHRGQVFSRESLLQSVWGYEYPFGTRTVDVHVRWLREKIEREPGEPRHIQTVRGVGYRFAR